jgi:hypothetical protein
MAFLFVFLIPYEPNYYQSVRKFLKGNVYDQSARDLGLSIRRATNPGDFVYIWGFHMGVQYYFSDRISPSRYFSEPFLGRPGALAEVQRDLKKNKPALVAIPLEKYPLPDWLQKFLDAGYARTGQEFGYDMYRPL